MNKDSNQTAPYINEVIKPAGLVPKMKCVVAIGLLLTLTSVICEDDRVEPVLTKPRPIGVIYLIQFLHQPEIQVDNSEDTNTIPSGNPYKNSKLLVALTPNNLDQVKSDNREGSD